MVVKELVEPKWEKQKGETPTQHDWFNEFLDYSGYSLKAFHEYLEKHYKSLEVTEDIKIPSYDLLKKWSSHNKWTRRKKAYRDFEKEEEREELKQIKKEHKIPNFVKKQEISEQLLKEIALGLTTGKPLSQINQGIQGYVTLNEDDRKELGEDVENLKVTAELESTNQVNLDLDMSDERIHSSDLELLQKILEDKS